MTSQTGGGDLPAGLLWAWELREGPACLWHVARAQGEDVLLHQVVGHLFDVLVQGISSSQRPLLR